MVKQGMFEEDKQIRALRKAIKKTPEQLEKRLLKRKAELAKQNSLAFKNLEELTCSAHPNVKFSKVHFQYKLWGSLSQRYYYRNATDDFPETYRCDECKAESEGEKNNSEYYSCYNCGYVKGKPKMVYERRAGFCKTYGGNVFYCNVCETEIKSSMVEVD